MASALIFASASAFSRSAWALACASSAWRRLCGFCLSLALRLLRSLSPRRLLGLGLGEGLRFRLLALGLRLRERLIGLPLGLGLGLRLLRCLFLGLPQGCGFRLGLALRALPPRPRCVAAGLVDLSRSRLPARFDVAP